MAWFFALTCTVNCGTLYRQVFSFPNHAQSSEFATGGLQSSCWNVSRLINGKNYHCMPPLSTSRKPWWREGGIYPRWLPELEEVHKFIQDTTLVWSINMQCSKWWTFETSPREQRVYERRCGVIALHCIPGTFTERRRRKRHGCHTWWVTERPFIYWQSAHVRWWEHDSIPLIWM